MSEAQTPDHLPGSEAWDYSLKQPTLLRKLAVLPTWLAAGTLFFLMAMTFADVILRSLFNSPIEAATELTRLSMAVLVFAALPMVTWKGDNIVVDLLDPVFTQKLARLRDTAMDLICGVLLFWPSKRVFDLAERARDYGDVTEYLHLPQFYAGWFIALFTGLTALTFIARGITRLVAPAEVEK